MSVQNYIVHCISAVLIITVLLIVYVNLVETIIRVTDIALSDNSSPPVRSLSTVDWSSCSQYLTRTQRLFRKCVFVGALRACSRLLGNRLITFSHHSTSTQRRQRRSQKAQQLRYCSRQEQKTRQMERQCPSAIARVQTSNLLFNNCLVLIFGPIKTEQRPNLHGLLHIYSTRLSTTYSFEPTRDYFPCKLELGGTDLCCVNVFSLPATIE